MEFLELAKNRFSVRSYEERQVEQEKIDKILEAAKVAPTAKNLQPQKIYILKSEEAVNKIRQISRCAYNAPMVFLICANEDESWKSPYVENYNSGEMDASIVTTHMMLEASELGLGSVWVKLFDPIEVIKAFDLPANIKPICLLPVGYPAINAQPSAQHTSCKEIQEFVTEL